MFAASGLMISGLLSFALATIVLQRCAPASGAIPSWVNLPGMQAAIVFVVLGGWTLGGTLVVYALVGLYSQLAG